MRVYEYKCSCGAVMESEHAADRLESCPTELCSGKPKRVWSVGLLRENIRAVPRG